MAVAMRKYWSELKGNRTPWPRAAAQGYTADHTAELMQKLEALTKSLDRYKKEGKEAKVKETQTKIDSILKQLKAEGEVIVISGAGRPLAAPAGADGNVEYGGLPPDRLQGDYLKNVAKKNAQKVRDGVKSIDAWAKRLDDKSGAYAAKRAKLDAVMSRSEDVNLAFAQDLKGGGFKKLSKAVGPDFEQSLASYEQSASDVKISMSNLREQACRIAAAKAMVQQAEMLLEGYQKEKERDADGKKLAELKEQLADLKAAAGFVVDAAVDTVKDPEAAAKKVAGKFADKVKLKITGALVDSIVDGLLGGEKLKQEMAEIEARITAVNKRLEALKLGGLTAGVNQAWSTVSAEFEKANTAQLALAKAKRAQGHAVDALATMEKNHPNTTTVFGQLQEFYGDVQQAGHEAMQLSKEYEGDLAAVQKAMAHTADLKQTVETDRASLNHLYPLNEVNVEELEARARMDSIIDYTKKMDDWYKAKKVGQQIDEQKRVREDLRQNKQFDYIGTLVNSVQEQGLGHVQRDGKIAS